MTKKLIIVWLTLLMVLFSSISIYAEEDIQGDFFEKHIIINGEEIINYNLQYPFFLYNNTTYFPLSPEMQEILGISAEMDWESRTLKLLKTESTRTNISQNWLKNNNVDPKLNVVSEVKVLAFIEETSGAEQTEGDLIESPTLTVKEVDIEGRPILSIGKYLFLPVMALADEEIFNWDIYFDAYYGLCISTIEGTAAQSYCDAAEALRNRGLVQYMKYKNPTVTTSVAQHYLFLFKRASDVYSVDEELLMAVASKESTFYRNATSRSGARGLMQIMDTTGARYGLTVEDLYNEKFNIDFGAMYISERIAAYGGDLVKGLSAYNQGSSRVNRGTHSTVYADRVITEYNKIGNYLAANGYVAQ